MFRHLVVVHPSTLFDPDTSSEIVFYYNTDSVMEKNLVSYKYGSQQAYGGNNPENGTREEVFKDKFKVKLKNSILIVI